MRKLGSIMAAMCILALFGACTARYSQTVTGKIRKVNTYKIVNATNGTDVGIGIGGGIDIYPAAHGIVMKEPKSATELMNYPCQAEFVEVDYRSKWYAYYIRIDSPEVTVTTYCIEE